MKKAKKQKPREAPVDKLSEYEPLEMPSFMKRHLLAQQKRVSRFGTVERKLAEHLLSQIGITRRDLEKQADAEFAQAKADSAKWLKELRKVQSMRLKKRRPVREQIELAYFRFEKEGQTK